MADDEDKLNLSLSADETEEIKPAQENMEYDTRSEAESSYSGSDSMSFYMLD